MPVCGHGHVSSLPIAAVVLSLVAVCSAQGLPPDVQELGVALAARGVPAGLVVPEEAPADATEEYPSPAVQAAASARVLFATGALPAVLSRFNAASASLRATDANGVVHVRSLDEPREVRAALERRVYVEPADDVPVMEAVFMRVLGLLAGREAQALQDDALARSYLALRHPSWEQVDLVGHRATEMEDTPCQRLP